MGQAGPETEVVPIAKIDTRTIMALLPPGVTADNQRHRRQRGLEVEAPDWLQPVADRLVQELATSVDVAKASGIVARSLPAWSDAVCLIETGDQREIFLVVSVLDANRYQIGVGQLKTEVAKVPPTAKSLPVVSLNKLLAQLRKDAKERGIELPERLTPPLGTFEYVQWRAQFDSPEHLAMARALYERQQRMRQANRK
jgi:hypothetical protein